MRALCARPCWSADTLRSPDPVPLLLLGGVGLRLLLSSTVIVGKFLRGFPTDDGVQAPQVRVVSMYIDQIAGYNQWDEELSNGGFPSADPIPADHLPMGVLMAKKYNVKLVDSIQAALCYDAETGTVGTDLAVDGVLAIAEHGNYPVNEKGQKYYPRRHFYEQISGVMANSPKRFSCPIFTDKHLAVTWEDALYIYNTGKKLGLTHMAGSSVPVCFWRDPWLEHDLSTPLEQACMLSYGDLEAYGCAWPPSLPGLLSMWPSEPGCALRCRSHDLPLCAADHGLEALQAMVERRPGGEAGIVAAQCLEGEAMWAAAAEGRWSRELASAAMGVVDLVNPGAWA